jgi:hypothetical protein
VRGEQGSFSFSEKIIVPVVVALLVALVAGGSAPWWWSSVFGSDDDARPPTTSSFVTVPTSGSVTPPVTTGSPDSTIPPPSGCAVTVSNPLATLHLEPDVFSQELMRVPPGVYAPSSIRQVTFVGEDQRWLEITVSGRTGWIQDNTFNIASRTADCP